MIVVLDRGQDSPHLVTLETVFANQKYYKVNDRIAKLYMWQIIKAVHALHSCMHVHRNINMRNIVALF